MPQSSGSTRCPQTSTLNATEQIGSKGSLSPRWCPCRAIPAGLSAVVAVDLHGDKLLDVAAPNAGAANVNIFLQQCK